MTIYSSRTFVILQVQCCEESAEQKYENIFVGNELQSYVTSSQDKEKLLHVANVGNVNVSKYSILLIQYLDDKGFIEKYIKITITQSSFSASI